MAEDIVADRVQETTTTVGTIAFVLAGVRQPGQAFGDVMADGDTCCYCAFQDSTSDWEVGSGTYVLSTNSLERTHVHASSNAGALVNFAAGTKNVDLVLSAYKIQLQNLQHDIFSSITFPAGAQQIVASYLNIGASKDLSLLASANLWVH
jgi:hypothetical protein